jgi:hypothetical protein
MHANGSRNVVSFDSVSLTLPVNASRAAAKLENTGRNSL